MGFGSSIQSLFEHASARGARSTVLHPLQWALFLSIIGTVGNAGAGGPQWLTGLLAVVLCTVTLVLLVFYGIAFFRDPDLLRSEKYAIDKMMVERNLIGDDTTGEFKEDDKPSIPARVSLPPTDPSTGEGEEDA